MKVLILIVFSAFQTLVWAQAPDSLRVDTIQEPLVWVKPDFSYGVWHTDLPERDQIRYFRRLKRSNTGLRFQERLNEISITEAEKGYAGASLDSTHVRGDTLHIWQYRGMPYRMLTCEIQGLTPQAFHSSGIQKRLSFDTPFSIKETESVFSGILRYYQDQGYPFSALKQDTLQYVPAKDSSRVWVNMRYTFDPGQLYRIDSFLVMTKVRENPKFIKNILRIHEGDIYRYSDIQSIPTQLNNTIYYQQVPVPEEQFSEDGKVILRLYPVPRKASRFDGVIGVLPPVDTTAKLQLTGLLDFNLVSPFGTGEILSLRFEQLPSNSQRLALKYIQPWILGTPVKVETELNILKQDTSFLNRYFKIIPYYQLNRFLSIKVWYRNKTSALLSTSLYKNSKEIPPILDSKEQTLGFGFEYDKLDYRLNPSKGFIFKTDFGAGTKNLSQNSGLDSLDYSQILMRLPLREFSLDIKFFFSPIKRQVILLANRSFRLDQAQYFRNDLYQIGGAYSIRGFNENQFFARYFTFFTLEYRFLLDQNSNLFAFCDYARLERREADFSQQLTPVGLGAGINFETRAGILNVTFATGKVGDIPFSPARPRVHFGIISMF